MTLPKHIKELLCKLEITTLRPAQEKALKKGLLKGNNILVCTPTASGKTLIALMGLVNQVRENKKGVYVVPLKALATEKYRSFSKLPFKVALSIGDLDETDKKLSDADIIIVTAEKLDSLLRHHTPWINKVGLLVVDEIHLLNDPYRGPTLEMLITLIRRLCNPQIIGLSATIGNPQELSSWLKAELVQDDWRPVRLDQGVFLNGEIRFTKQS